jgi:hypothetical protein
MTGHTCRTTGCTRPALSDRATCGACRPRTYQSKARPADLTVVDAVVHNRRGVPGLSPADQRLISRRLTTLGLPAWEIARIVGRSPRTICRWRAADRATTATPDDAREAEFADLDGQGVGPVALHTANTVPTGSYL